MAEHELTRLLSQIRRRAARGDAGPSDAHLLERFAVGGDEAAFELLVWRHQRLVFGVCRRVLHDVHDAEDAFQATFLALARKAGSIGKRAALASWLYKVAYRAALTARAGRARRTTREQPIRAADEFAAPPSFGNSLERQDLEAIVDEEVSRLPERFRVATVLCYLEGKTVEEAALQLGCPRGTVASRLARARQRLRTRLARRGLALTTASLTAAFGETSVWAATPERLVRATAQTARLYAAGSVAAGPGVPVTIATLTEEVLRAMFIRKLTTATAILVACAGVLLLGSGVAFRIYANAGTEPAPLVVATDAPLGQNAARDPGPVTPPTPVTVRRPVQRQTVPFEDFTGRLEGTMGVSIRAVVDGVVQKVHFKSSEAIKKGSLLFEIDPRPSRSALAPATVDLVVAETQLEAATEILEKARKAYEAGFLTRKTLDQIADERAIAQQKRDAVRAPTQRARRNPAEASRVVAPANGTIVAQLVKIGDSVSAGGPHTSVLAILSSPDLIGLRFDMDERSYLRYQRLLRAGQVEGRGNPLHIGLADEDDFPHEGTLDRFDNHINPATGTIAVHGLVSNPDRLLLPGMFARVRMPFGKPRSYFVVPEGAVFSDQGKRYVWVVNDRKVERRDVKLGAPASGGMRVVSEGLRPDDWVVTAGAKGLQPGDSVTGCLYESARRGKGSTKD
jgi:RND family efflux transporter MFP subunit